ncbi:RHS repeat-associated protein [Nakamurella sp. UYEF19]|uniref:RHS repeat domain-containing protein n=1 Tax=Nakamurella sp. UYEF19 TaxID=1756392 RepID=UPI003391D9A2
MVRIRLLWLGVAASLVLAGCTTGGRAVPFPSGTAGTSGATTGATAPTPPTTTTGTAAPDDPALDACDILRLLPCARQVAQFSLPIAGSNITLTYSSDRAAGRTQDSSPTADKIGLGGWTLSVLDSLDPATMTMISGSGVRRKVMGVSDSGQTMVADPGGAVVDVFDAQGRAIAVTDATTGAALQKFSWGAHGLTGVSDSSGVALTVVRATDGTPTRLDVTGGASTFLTAGAPDQVNSTVLTAVRYPDGSQATISTNSNGLVTDLVDRTGTEFRAEYDEQGRMAASRDGTGARTGYQRELAGNTLTVTTTPPTGGSIVDTVSRAGAVTTWLHKDAAGTAQSVAANGSDAILTDADGSTSTVTLAPDPRWGDDALLVSKMVSGTTTVTGSRANSGTDVEKTWSVDGNTWKFAYDEASRTTTQTDPAGLRTTAVHDTTGRITGTTAPGAAPISYTYGTAGRVASITVGTGVDARVWTYAYSGDTVTVTDPTGAVRTLSLTPTGGLRKLLGPAGSGFDLSLDASDRVIGFGTHSGSSYRVTWGANGQIAALNAPAGQGGPQFTGFDYDTAGNLVKQFTSDTTLSITRDAAGRIQAYNAGAGGVATAYDTAGRLTTLTSTTGNLSRKYTGGFLTSESLSGPVRTGVSRTTDSLGRTTGLAVAGGSTLPVSYDKAGQVDRAGNLRIVRDPASGLVTSRTLGTLTAAFEYNQFGEQARETVTGPGGRTVAMIASSRDRLGRLAAVATTLGTTTDHTSYSYDPAGRLASESTGGARITYTHDQAGNLTSVTDADGKITSYTYDGRNALIRRGNTSYTYDGAGQLATATSPAGTSTYRYDAAGRLLSVAQPGKAAVTYSLDGFGRRTSTSVGGKVTGALVYLDALRPAAQLDAAGKVLQQFVYTGSSTTPDYLTASGIDYLQVPDATGGPGLVINATTGALTDRVVRTALGMTVSETSPDFEIIGYAGGIVDPATDLVRFGARDYSTTTGTWTAPDPLTIGGGSANLYEHVGGDPVNRRDPEGLCDYTSLGINFGAGFGPYASGSFGVATAGGQLGLYSTSGLGIGAGAGVGIGLTCLDRDKPSDSPPTLDPFSGTGRTADGGIGPFSGGADKGYDNNGNQTSHGGHIGFGEGTPVGGSVTKTSTSFLCLFGCSPQTVTVCGDLGCSEGPSNSNAEPPPTSPSPSGKGPRSTGDPHLSTADLGRYDLMAVGEFTWLTTDSGSLTVQVRQQPAAGSRSVSVNTAVAVDVGGDRLMIASPDQTALKVTSPGVAVPGAGTFTLPHGAVVVLSDAMLTITLTDGTKLWVYPNPRGLDVNASLPDSLHGRVHGLAGPFTGAYTGSVETKGGVSIPIDQLKDYKTLYRTFGDSWRITQAASLFTDHPGTDSTAFDDPTFPDPAAAAPSAAALASATAICTQLDLTRADLADCIKDVSVTGDAGFASTGAVAADVVPGAVSSDAVSSGTAAGAAGGIAPGRTIRGTVTAGGRNDYAFTVAAGTVAYFAADPGCTPPPAGKGSILWNITDDQHSTYTGATEICGDQGRVLFAKAGTYHLVVVSADGASGAFSVTWRTSRPDLSKTLTSGSTATGDIDLPGAKDVYAVAVTAGTVGYFAAAADCVNPPPGQGNIYWSLQDPGGSTFTGATEICGDQGRVVFPTTGTYLLVVISAGGGTGAYTVSWKTSRPDVVEPLVSGATVSGDIDLPGADDVYTLAVTAGTVAYFAAAAGCADPASGPLYWYLQNPDSGTLTGASDVCTDQGRVVFPTAGTYRLLVTSNQGSIGKYTISWKPSRPDLLRPLVISSTQNGRIDVPGAHDNWTFTLPTSTKLTFTATTGCVSRNMSWQVQKADGGTVSGSADICSDLGDLTPPAGSYQLSVSGYQQATADYSFSTSAG